MAVIAARQAVHPLRPLLWVLAVFSMLEFVLLRFVGALSFDQAIAGEATAGGWASSIGAFSLDMATVLAFVCLLVFALTPVRWRSGWSFTIVAYVVLGVLLPWASSLGPWVPAAFGTVSSAIAVIAGLVAICRPDAHGRFAVALLVLAYGCAFVYALSPMVLPVGSTVAPGGPGTIGFGEVIYLLAGVFAFRAWGWERVRENRAALYAGLSASVGLGIYFAVGGPSAAAALTVSTGLTLFLPVWVYVLSTFFFASTAFACLLDRDAFATGAAFIVFLVVGLLPGTSYQQALLVLGMILLAHGEASFAIGVTPAQSVEADLVASG